MRIAREELYGPILIIFRFKAIDEIIERSNELRDGIITRDWKKAMAMTPMTRRLDVGTRNRMIEYVERICATRNIRRLQRIRTRTNFGP